MTTHRWRLDGQTALITGASAGIGLAIARELLGFGADLLMVARDADALAQARDELADEFPERELHGLAADVSDDEERRAILDWVEDHADGLHLLINNAGGNITRAAIDYTEDQWRGIFETNVFSAFELSRYAHPLLTQHAASAIVNVGSVSGITHVRSGAPYGMTKAALQQMTRNLAVEWAEDGIRVNAVAPWYIRTRRTSGPLSDPDYYEQVIERTPMRRIGEPEEVAAAVGFCACQPPVTSPANASRWTAACATGSSAGNKYRLVPIGCAWTQSRHVHAHAGSARVFFQQMVIARPPSRPVGSMTRQGCSGCGGWIGATALVENPAHLLIALLAFGRLRFVGEAPGGFGLLGAFAPGLAQALVRHRRAAVGDHLAGAAAPVAGPPARLVVCIGRQRVAGSRSSVK